MRSVVALSCALALIVVVTSCGGGSGGGSRRSEFGAVANAKTVVLGLKSAELPIRRFTVFTAATDPNALLGRTGGYKSKANFADRRLSCSNLHVTCDPKIDSSQGGSVEVFASQAEAEDRADYLESSEKAFGFIGHEYFYVRGGVLLRVSGVLTPVQARAYRRALFAMR